MVSVHLSDETINHYKKYISILFFYTILTIILTYPVAFMIGTDIPNKGGDAFQAMNTLWYTNFAILHPGITSLDYDNMIFYPVGIPVMPFPTAFNQLVTIALIPFFQIQIIYSFLWLLSFIIAAFGAFLLVRYLTQNDYAAFLSGIVFAFVPYHFVHGLGHIGALSIQWIPFCALFFMKVFREGGIKNCVFAGFFYILVAMSDLQYLVFMGIFIAVLFLYEHVINLQIGKKPKFETHKSIFIKYVITGIVAFSVILPLTLSDIRVASSENNFLLPNQTDTLLYSANLESFFLPSIFHPVFGDFVFPIYRKFTGNFAESTEYIGYSVLILSFLAVYFLRKDQTVRFWGIIALLFSLFSLGPVLHIGNRTGFSFFNFSLPMPYILLQYTIPFIENSRTPGRLFIIAILAFSVLAGYACNELLKRYETKKIIILIVLSGLIIFEYLSVPVPMSPVDRPAFYQNLGHDPDRYALMEIPMTSNYSAGVKIIYYQTIHGKPVVGGQYARALGNAGDFEGSNPFINGLTFQKPISKDIIDYNLSETGNSILSHYGIRYVILHTDYLNVDELNFVNNTLLSSLGQPDIYKNDSLIVYQVKNEIVNNFMVLNGGWYTIENWSGLPGRWISTNTSLSIYSTQDRQAILSLNTISLNRSRILEVLSPDQNRTLFTVATNFTMISVPTQLNKGENLFRFNTRDTCEKPSDISELNSSDKRCLTIAFQNISLS